MAGAPQLTTLQAAGSTWKPTWLVRIDPYAEMGIKIDDGCAVVLVKDPNDDWVLAHHIPMLVVDKLAELRASGALDVARRIVPGD